MSRKPFARPSRSPTGGVFGPAYGNEADEKTCLNMDIVYEAVTLEDSGSIKARDGESSQGIQMKIPPAVPDYEKKPSSQSAVKRTSDQDAIRSEIAAHGGSRPDVELRHRIQKVMTPENGSVQGHLRWHEGETLAPRTFCKTEDHAYQVSRAMEGTVKKFSFGTASRCWQVRKMAVSHLWTLLAARQGNEAERKAAHAQNKGKGATWKSQDRGVWTTTSGTQPCGTRLYLFRTSKSTPTPVDELLFPDSVVFQLS